MQRYQPYISTMINCEVIPRNPDLCDIRIVTRTRAESRVSYVYNFRDTDTSEVILDLQIQFNISFKSQETNFHKYVDKDLLLHLLYIFPETKNLT